MSQMDWTDRKWFKRILYPLMVAGAILGMVLGALAGESVGERIAFALLGGFGGFTVPALVMGLSVMFAEGLVVWIKARGAKSLAYYMIESGKIYSEEFQKVISALERWNDREARHLVHDLYELEQKLEQIPDKEEDELDEDSLLKAMSTGDLEALKVKYKKNPSVTKLIDGILEARGSKA